MLTNKTGQPNPPFIMSLSQWTYLGNKEYCSEAFLETGLGLTVGKKVSDGWTNNIIQVEMRLWNERRCREEEAVWCCRIVCLRM